MSTYEPPAGALDDYHTEPLTLPQHRRLPRLTLVLAGAVLGALLFLGGIEAQRHFGSGAATSGAAASASAGRFAGRTGGGAFRGFGGTGAAASGITAGTVTAIKGKTLYVTDAGGNVVKVSTSAAAVTKTVTANAKAIDPGDSVLVTGTTGANGIVAARSISIGGADVGFGTGAGGGGGATGFGG